MLWPRHRKASICCDLAISAVHRLPVDCINHPAVLVPFPDQALMLTHDEMFNVFSQRHSYFHNLWKPASNSLYGISLHSFLCWRRPQWGTWHLTACRRRTICQRRLYGFVPSFDRGSHPFVCYCGCICLQNIVNKQCVSDPRPSLICVGIKTNMEHV